MRPPGRTARRVDPLRAYLGASAHRPGRAVRRGGGPGGRLRHRQDHAAAPDGGPLQPAEGEVRLFGEPSPAAAGRPAARRRRFGMLFQQGALFSALNVFANVAFPLREFGIDDEGCCATWCCSSWRWSSSAPTVALRMPAELSGGMVKRVALARALAPRARAAAPRRAHRRPRPGPQRRLRAPHPGACTRPRADGHPGHHDLDTLAALATRGPCPKGVYSPSALEEIMRVQDPFIQRFSTANAARRLARGRG